MRIGVALSGQPRTWRHTIEPMRRFFADHEIEIFLHTWDEGDPAERQALLDAYQPQGFCVEPRPSFLREKEALARRFPAKPPLTVFDMLHSVARSIELACEAHLSGPPLDVICRTRFDITYDGRWASEAASPGEIFLPTGYGVDDGCSDQFALGAPSALEAYAGVGAWLPGALSEIAGDRFRPETALLTYLERAAGLSIHLRPYAVALLRESQVGRPFAELRDDPLFHAGKHEAWAAFAKAHFAPELQPNLDFSHSSLTAFRLDRDFSRWLGGQSSATRTLLLGSPWPQRLAAIDAFLGGQVSRPFDSGSYGKLRYFCATLLHHMARDEPLSLEAFVVHALSANSLDVERYDTWVRGNPQDLQRLPQLLDQLDTLKAAFAHAEPLQQPTASLWRVA